MDMAIRRKEQAEYTVGADGSELKRAKKPEIESANFKKILADSPGNTAEQTARVAGIPN